MANKLTIREQNVGGKTIIYVSDGVDEVSFTRYKDGIYYYGNKKVKEAVDRNKSFLQGMGLTESALNVIIPVSENEGELDAVNTWDNSFMTFGMFQWTIGVSTEPGELAALLARIKNGAPDIFKTYYGQYGMDIQLKDRTCGYIVLDGRPLVSATDKAQFRTEVWAFYFWKSAQNPQVQSFQVQHALSRLETFYRAENCKPNGFYISDLITSEYGVALLLDYHVNRPSYVAPCLAQAMTQARLVNPGTWGTTEEEQLINEYLKVRKIYGNTPMTDADKRAGVIKNHMMAGAISGARGSFHYNPIRS